MMMILMYFRQALYRTACFEGVIRVFSTLNKYLNNQTDKLCGNMESLLIRILGRDWGGLCKKQVKLFTTDTTISICYSM